MAISYKNTIILFLLLYMLKVYTSMNIWLLALNLAQPSRKWEISIEWFNKQYIYNHTIGSLDQPSNSALKCTIPVRSPFNSNLSVYALSKGRPLHPWNNVEARNTLMNPRLSKCLIVLFKFVSIKISIRGFYLNGY